MKIKIFFFFLICTFSCVKVFSQNTAETSNAVSYEQNKIHARTMAVPYTHEDKIPYYNYYTSPYFLLLNDKWKFAYFEKIIDTVKDFHSTKFDDQAWKEVDMPHIWQVSDVADFSVENLQWIATPPSVEDAYNSMGIYRKKIFPAKEWRNRTTILHIAMAKAGVQVWVNGQAVGYNYNAETASEFDISAFLKYDAENIITLAIPKRSMGSYLDLSNNVNLQGIFGDVFIYSKAPVSVFDYSIDAYLDEAYRDGSLNVNFVIENNSKKSETYFLELELWNERNEVVEKFYKYFKTSKKDTFSTVDFAETITLPRHWTAETPNLYTVVFRLKDSKQNEVEINGCRVGFKRIELKNGLLLVNGQAIKFKGVNYTPYDTKKGVLLDEEDFLKDIRLMKMNNINAVRTMGGALPESFYQLCNEHGIYVVNETGLCALTGEGSKNLLRNPDWSEAVLAKVRNTYERDKNYPCIAIWSLGSNTENGKNYEEAYKWLKERCPHIPIQCIGAQTSWNSDIYAAHCSDLKMLSAYGVKRQKTPLIFADYLNSYGNSLGGLKSYWDTIALHEQLQGGFISSWADQAWQIPAPNNEEALFWTKEPQKFANSATTNEGLLQADRTPKPELAEVKAVYANFSVRALNIKEGEFEVYNGFDFLNLKDFELSYHVFSNLKESVSEGDISVDVKPKQKASFAIMIPKMNAYSNEEYFISFSLRQKQGKTIVPVGYYFGTVTFPLKMQTEQRTIIPESEIAPIYTKEEDTQWLVYNDEFELKFNKKQGEITALYFKGNELLTKEPSLNFFRPPTQNDLLDENGYQLWKSYGLESTTKQIKEVAFKIVKQNMVRITVIADILNASNNSLFNLVQTYTIYGTGDVFIENQLKPVLKMINMPSVGMKFYVSKDFEKATWFGMKDEIYPDRNAAQAIGLYEQPLSKMSHQYIKPQASGNRMNTRWFSISSEDSVGLFVDMDSYFQFSVNPYNDADFKEAATYAQVKEQNYWNLNVDIAQSPVGSDFCGESMNENLLVKSHDMEFVVHLKPFETERYNPDQFRLSRFNYGSEEVLETPQIVSNRANFDTTLTITLSHSLPDVVIRYTLDGKEPTESSPIYGKPFTIQTTTIIKAKAYKKGVMPSFTATRAFQFSYVKNITYENQPNTPYNKDMQTIPFDKVRGKGSNFERYWTGFSGSDVDALIELVKPLSIKSVSVGFGHAPETWVFLPSEMTVEISTDGKTFSAPVNVTMPFDPLQEKTEKPVAIDVKAMVNAANVRYIRIKAKNIGRLPVWHQAKGLKAWIMLDEIEIEEGL